MSGFVWFGVVSTPMTLYAVVVLDTSSDGNKLVYMQELEEGELCYGRLLKLGKQPRVLKVFEKEPDGVG